MSEIEPTVLIRREDMGRRPADTDPRVTFPPLPLPRPGSRSTSEATMIAQPRSRTASSQPKSSSSVGAMLQSLGERFHRGNDRHRRSPSSTRRAASTGSLLSTPAARGAMLAIATVAVGAILVWGLFLVMRSVWPAGKVLTITRPVGGTIRGSGIECGTEGSKCSTTITTGEPIELSEEHDKDYVFSGYTGDCAPAGRTSMTEPRTCGATFDHVVGPAPAVTFRLSITKPEGGTVVGNGGILCGTNGSTCTADILSGVPVSLKGEADDGYSFSQFTGECPSTGDMMMTSAKTCGVIFNKSLAPINVGPVGRPVATAQPIHQRPPVPPPATPPPVATLGPSPTKPGAPGPQGSTTGPTLAPTGPDNKPPTAAKTAEEHAKDEIGQLVKNYCTALGTLKPDAVRKLFHLDNERELKAQYKEYKSLKCTVTAAPEFDRLDAGAAGAAQLKFGMKQAIKMSSGGAPNEQETTVTMVVSRKDFDSPWLIDRLTHEVKPK